MSNIAPTPLPPPDLAKSLINRVGVAEGYAYDLANGRRGPSLKLARKIKDELGIPVDAWPMPEKV